MKFLTILTNLLTVANSGENWNNCDIGREITSEIGHYKIGNCSNGRFSKSKGELKMMENSQYVTVNIFNYFEAV